MTEQLPTNQWEELDRNRREQIFCELHDRELQAIERRQAQDPDWKPPCTSKDLQRVHDDALKAIVRDRHMPLPGDVATELLYASPDAAQALIDAYLGNREPYVGCWRVAQSDFVAVLRTCGLVGWVGPKAGLAVTSFGLAVRKVLRGEPLRPRSHGGDYFDEQ